MPLAALCALLHASALWAADATEAQVDGPWEGQLAAGVVATSGNSESRSQNLEYTLVYDQADDDWRFKSTGLALQVATEIEIEQLDGSTRSETRTTAENYRVDLRAERRIDEANYLFGTVDFRKDLFGAVRTSTSQTLGYGRRLIAREDTALDLEIGAGARQQELQEDGAENQEAIGELGLNFLTQFGDRLQLGQRINVKSGADNTVSEGQTRLRLAIIGALWAQLGFDVRHSAEVGAGEEATDTATSLSLLWEFAE